MIIASWNRNIAASIIKHFDTLRGNTYMYIPGHPNDKRKDNSEWFEIRVIGPEYRETSRNSFSVEVEVDFLIQVNTEKNLYAFQNISGDISSWFTCINVFDDNTALLGMLQLDEAFGSRGIVVTPFAIAKEHPHQVGTVVGVYRMNIDN